MHFLYMVFTIYDSGDYIKIEVESVRREIIPRKIRVLTETGLYHVIMRGINKQIIFEKPMDYQIFLQILQFYKEESNFKLYAYCLMDNHIHLLLKEGDIPLADLIKKIEVKFARNYNYYYQRCGVLFQDRYKSEPITTEAYFLTVARYIMQNPMHAGLEKAPGTYKWSSFFAYCKMDNSFVDVDIMRHYFKIQKDMLDFFCTDTKEKCMEYYSRLPDEEALRIMQEKTNCIGPMDFVEMRISERDRLLEILLKEGISIRQLSRITGVNRTSIERVSRKMHI